MKFALVLGASGEIGHAICRELAQDGWSLYLHYSTNVSRIEQLLQQLETMYPEQYFLPMQANLYEPEQVGKLAQSIVEVEAIIVAHGVELLKLVSDTTDEEMDYLWKVHVQSPIKIISTLSARMQHKLVSYVIFIGSIWGSAGAANEVLYSTVKGAQHAFVRAYAKEVASLGIRVNGVAPGWIDTKMNRMFNEEERKEAQTSIPLQQIGTPADVANYVTFLVSGRADYMTGEVINLNGGWYIS